MYIKSKIVNGSDNTKHDLILNNKMISFQIAIYAFTLSSRNRLTNDRIQI